MMPARPLLLVCLPCAGASATMYLRWRRMLPAWVELLPLELPGRGARMDQPLATDSALLVRQLLDELAPKIHNRAYALFGHSMGALLGYGMYQQARLRQMPLPLALLVSASPAPAMRDPARFDRLDNDAALIADMKRQGGTPDAVFAHPELLRMSLDVLAADYRICKNFSAVGPLPALPVHVFAGRDDDISQAQLEAWRGSAGFTLDWFDGGHFYLRQYETTFIQCLQQRLQGLQGLQGAPDALCA